MTEERRGDNIKMYVWDKCLGNIKALNCTRTSNYIFTFSGVEFLDVLCPVGGRLLVGLEYKILTLVIIGTQ